MFSVPRAGHVVGWLTGPRGLFLLGLYAAFLVIVLLRREDGTGPSARQIDRGGRRRAARVPRSRGGARVLTIVSALVLTGGAAVGRATPVWAAWGDGVTVSGTTLGSMDVPSPSTIGCSGDLSTTVTISTTAVADSRVQYVARLFTAATGGTQVGAEQVMTGSGATRQASYSVKDFPGLGLGTTYYARVYSRLTATPAWESAGHRTFSFSATSLFVATVFGCGSEQP
jgi:hypothetical protein